MFYHIQQGLYDRRNRRGAMPHARKVDLNQPEIVNLLRAIPGMYVQVVSMYGGLGFDLMARYQDGPPHLLEIKDGVKQKLTDSEAAAKRRWDGYWHRVETFEDALRVFGISADPAPGSW